MPSCNLPYGCPRGLAKSKFGCTLCKCAGRWNFICDESSLYQRKSALRTDAKQFKLQSIFIIACDFHNGYRHFVKETASWTRLSISLRVFNSPISNVFHIPVASSIPHVFFLSFDGHLRENLNSREFKQPDYGKEKVTLNKHFRKSDYFAIFPSCSHSILLRNRPLIFKICPKSILTHAQLFNRNQSFLVPILEPPSPGESDVLVNIGNGRFTVLHFVV